MKIDSHQHFWRYNDKEFSWINENMGILKRDFLPADLLPVLHNAGFEGTLAVQARQNVAETEWLLKLADENDFIKGVVGWVELCSKNAGDQFEKYSDHPKLVGVRHVIHDETDDFFILRNDFAKSISLLSRYNLSYDILIFAHHLPQTIEFVRQFPNQVFVLDHIAKPEIKFRKISPWRENINTLSRFENVYCKLSGIVTEADWYAWTPEDIVPYLDTLVKAFGTKRLMIGSDWPVCLLAGDYKKVMSLITDYFSRFTEKEKADIYGLNAKRAYCLS